MTTLDEIIERLNKVIGPIQAALGGSLHIDRITIKMEGIKYKLIIEID